MAELTIAPVTGDRLADLATLFETNGTAGGCYCTWFLIPTTQCRAGWGGANRAIFEATARSQAEPMGLLAYVDGQPVGWCAVGPRSRYSRVLQTTVMRARDPAQDGSVWLVPCFFVRVGFRRQGIMRALLEEAVSLAAGHGATALEGFPLAGTRRRGTGDAYLGVEPLFDSCGFTVVDRPTPNRVLMRRELPSLHKGHRRRAQASEE